MFKKQSAKRALMFINVYFCLLFTKKPRKWLRGFYYVLKDDMRLEMFESFT